MTRNSRVAMEMPSKVKISVTKKWYTYALRYPEGFQSPQGDDLSNVVFYIGKGTGNRALQHLYYARNDYGWSTAAVIRDVWKRTGKQIGIDILYETDVERDALQYEWACTTVIYSSPYLINVKDTAHIKHEHYYSEVEERKREARRLKEIESRTHTLSRESQDALERIAQSRGVKVHIALAMIIREAI